MNNTSLTTKPTPNSLLTLKEAAEFLGITLGTLRTYTYPENHRRYYENLDIPVLAHPIEIDGNLRYQLSDLEKFLGETHRNTPKGKFFKKQNVCCTCGHKIKG